jgi:cellobiose-specific phosphotransferase system component IIC
MEYLGYIFIFYIGFYFYRLAENYKKNKWLFGFLGIINFIIGSFSYLLFCRLFNSVEFNKENLSSIGLKGFISGVIFSILIFQILNFIWSRKEKKYNNELDKIGKQ